MKDSLENDWSLERVDAEADVDALNMNRRIRNLGRKTQKKSKQAANLRRFELKANPERGRDGQKIPNLWAGMGSEQVGG
jgi:hypothetical protein